MRKPKIEGDVIALDLETRDPDLLTLGPGWAFPQRGGYPVGYSLAWYSNGEMQSIYLPVRHEGGGNLPLDFVKSIIAPLLSDPAKTIVMANCLYDYGWSLWEGFEWNAEVEDVQIMAPLLDDNRMSYSLNNLSKDYLGKKKEETGLYAAAKEWGLKDFKGDMWRLPASMVDEYARVDAELTLELYFKLGDLMAADDLGVVHQLEKDLVPVMYKMRKRGVRVDLDACEIAQKDFLSREEEAYKVLSSLTSHKIDPWAAASIVAALEAEGVTEFPLTDKKKEKSIDNDFLQRITLADPDGTAGKIAEQAYRLRKWQKARSTFVENMMLGHSINGRIHSELKALRSDEGGTVSGRFSCVNPNLQQVPARDPELGPMIRSLLLPDNGQWAAIDYASQEPRLAVHFGVRARCTGADELAEVFRKDPRSDPYLPTAELCGITRKDAKTIRLGILYGMGGGTLCASLGLPTEPGTWKGRQVLYAGTEGKALLEKFNRNSPMDKELSRLASNNATKRGWVKTILGRRSRFPPREDGEVWFTHKALNRVIQGSAADMTKQAMVNIYRETGTVPLVSVHDELGFDVESPSEAHIFADYMEHAIELEVPVVTDIEIGSSWGASMGNKLKEEA